MSSRPTTEEQVNEYLLERARSTTCSSLDGLDYFCLVICVVVAIEATVGYYGAVWLLELLRQLQPVYLR